MKKLALIVCLFIISCAYEKEDDDFPKSSTSSSTLSVDFDLSGTTESKPNSLETNSSKQALINEVLSDLSIIKVFIFDSLGNQIFSEAKTQLSTTIEFEVFNLPIDDVITIQVFAYDQLEKIKYSSTTIQSIKNSQETISVKLKTLEDINSNPENVFNLSNVRYPAKAFKGTSSKINFVIIANSGDKIRYGISDKINGSPVLNESGIINIVSNTTNFSFDINIPQSFDFIPFEVKIEKDSKLIKRNFTITALDNTSSLQKPPQVLSYYTVRSNDFLDVILSIIDDSPLEELTIEGEFLTENKTQLIQTNSNSFRLIPFDSNVIGDLFIKVTDKEGLETDFNLSSKKGSFPNPISTPTPASYDRFHNELIINYELEYSNTNDLEFNATYDGSHEVEFEIKHDKLIMFPYNENYTGSVHLTVTEKGSEIFSKIFYIGGLELKDRNYLFPTEDLNHNLSGDLLAYYQFDNSFADSGLAGNDLNEVCNVNFTCTSNYSDFHTHYPKLGHTFRPDYRDFDVSTDIHVGKFENGFTFSALLNKFYYTTSHTKESFIFSLRKSNDLNSKRSFFIKFTYGSPLHAANYYYVPLVSFQTGEKEFVTCTYDIIEGEELSGPLTHYAFTINKERIILYENGEVKNECEFDTMVKDELFENVNNEDVILQIGNNFSDFDNGGYGYFLVDEFSLFSKDLDSRRIKSLYQKYDSLIDRSIPITGNY